ncbi:MAG: putative CXXCH cytochrome family protein, partial [Saprospiraceae bacterium]
ESEMTCITCHNPHKSIKVTGREQYNNTCINCHKTATVSIELAAVTCTETAEKRSAEDDDCSYCHMPKSGSIDIPHINITDHYVSKTNIQYRKKATAKNDEPAQFLGLKILTKDKGTPLEMANGYIALYDKYVRSPMILDSASYYLNQSTLPFAEKFKTTIHYLFSKESYEKIIQNAEQFPLENIKDGWTAYRIGQAFFAYADFENALKYYQKSVDYLPLHLDFQEKLGATYFNLKQIPKAKKVFEFVLSENKKRPVALSNLGYMKVLNGNIQGGMEMYDAALALDPDYENALLNKASALLFQKKNEAGKKLLERVLEINPENEQVKDALKTL